MTNMYRFSRVQTNYFITLNTGEFGESVTGTNAKIDSKLKFIESRNVTQSEVNSNGAITVSQLSSLQKITAKLSKISLKIL